MINHFRTLLLNTAPARVRLEPAKGDEYVDPNYVPMVLDGKLKRAHEALMPSVSRADRNFYAYALLRLAHAPDYEKYVMTFDSRIVYDVSASLYISADTARSRYPAFSLDALYVNLSSALMSPGPSVFAGLPERQADMDVFKDLWYGSAPCKDKVTAGLMATVYAMEGVRIHGR